MAGTVTHKFQSLVSDLGVSGELGPGEWNDEHLFAGGTNGAFLVRDSTQSDGVSWSNDYAGPYGIGAAPVSNHFLFIGGTHTAASSNGAGMNVAPTVTGVNVGAGNTWGVRIAAPLTMPLTGTLTGVYGQLALVGQTITNAGTATLATAATLYLESPMAGATTNWTLWGASGNGRWDGQWAFGAGTAAPTGQVDIVSSANARVPLRVSTAGSPTRPILVLQKDGVDAVWFNGGASAATTYSDVNSMVAAAFDNGTGTGNRILMRRNNNATTPAAGHIGLDNLSGNLHRIWPDATGLLRIATSEPTNANDTGGTVVGAQSSLLSEKSLLDRPVDPAEALSAVLALKPMWFQYKHRYPGETFLGLVIDDESDAWQRGKYPWYSMDNGKSLNEPSLIGHLVSAVQELKRDNDALRRDLASLRTESRD